ncbi:MAG: T9SS type A sorting domain-containing protein [Lentimicrobiaceae bacterium]|nr:T9SS type A sorting domain-containing protein [Lentimicrobiaceae bacterium]
MTQAITLSEMLQRNGHEAVEVLVGKSKEREIPEFFLKKVNTELKPFETPSLILKKNKKNFHLTKTILHISSELRVKNVSIINSAGQTVLTADAKNNRIDIASLAAGTYSIRLTTEEGIITKTFVKQ